MEGLFLVCVVSVYREIVPVDLLPPLLLCFFGCLSQRSVYLLRLVIHRYFDSGYHCFVIAIHVDLSVTCASLQ